MCYITITEYNHTKVMTKDDFNKNDKLIDLLKENKNSKIRMNFIPLKRTLVTLVIR